MLINQGLVGPKPRPKGVGDGDLVNIPEPLVNRYQLWRERDRDSKKSIGRLLKSKLVQLGKSGWTFQGFGLDVCELLWEAEAHGQRQL